MTKLIESVSHGVPAALTELRRLGPTLTNRAADVLAYFDRPGTSNGPTEAINGRLEHLRGSALGFPQPYQLSTTSPDHSWRAVDSDPGYTLDREEPGMVRLNSRAGGTEGGTREKEKQVTTTKPGPLQRRLCR